ncbi:FecR family protein [Luteimonas sp. R10]|uniref:FecR family protein n=1 Tax=Luteimonas sp. R10 TaxID=3108176 RepID=UPI00308EE6A8|nr:FecR domain-containing protein [Luteimonas sp. R10]
MRSHSQIVEDVVLAEASAWLARLQGPARTPATEAAFKAWLAVEPAHAQAFARVTDTWDIIPGAALLSVPSARPMAVDRRRRVSMALAACVALVAVAVGLTWRVSGDPVYHTAVGEQRTLVLDDGTRIALNTDSRIAVSYGEDERHIRLERGEALFEVARQPGRPFVVQAGEDRVRALGTTFVVRRDRGHLAVALIEGRVEVSRPSPQGQARPVHATVLSPGERITLGPDIRQTVDRPRIEAMAAWRRGEAMFNNATLAEAIAEINRYGGAPVRLEDPVLGQLRVSGVFATRDPAEFARTVAQLHALTVEHSEEDLVLKR